MDCFYTYKILTARMVGISGRPSIYQLFQVNLEQLPTLLSMQSVMSSFVEGYVASATKLTLLLSGPMLEKNLKEKMLIAAQLRVNDGLALRSKFAEMPF